MGQELIDIFSDAFFAVRGDALQMITLIVPVALGVAGVIFVARRAMKWFTGMIGR